MDLIAFLVPPIVTGIMFVFKRLAGLNWFANAAEAKPFLWTLLIVLSLIGQMSTALVTGTELDVDSVTALVQLGVVTVFSAYGSHWLYVLLNFARNWKDYI
jgi:hypothetical protein